MGPAWVLFVAAWATVPTVPATGDADGPLSDEELALLAALTSTAAEPPPPADPSVTEIPGARVRQTLARSLAEGLDGVATLFRTYRGRDVLALRRDGVRLPRTHPRGQLQDGWLIMDPNAVGRLAWQPAAGQRQTGLGATLAVDGLAPPRTGWAADMRALTRSADQGLGGHVRLGWGDDRRGFVAAGRFETLPTTRLQTDDAALRLGEQWSVHARGREAAAAVTVGVDWSQRRDTRRAAAEQVQRQDRTDHGLAFARADGEWGWLGAAYLRDEVVGDGRRASHRVQADAGLRWALSDRWRLELAAFGRRIDQRFGDRTGRAMHVEPSLSVRFQRDEVRLDVGGRALWGQIQADDASRVEGFEPLFFIAAAGPLGLGFGWRAMLQRSAHLPQPWHLDPGVSRTAMETSWSAEIGPTWRHAAGRARLALFAQRVQNYWARPALERPETPRAEVDVLGVEVEAVWWLLSRVELTIVGGWADDRVRAGAVDRPTSSQIRGFVSARYVLDDDRGFVQLHARVLSDSFRHSGPDVAFADPVRVGLVGGLRLGRAFELSVAIENVLDLDYDDRAVVDDRVGVDARIALTWTPFSGARL